MQYWQIPRIPIYYVDFPLWISKLHHYFFSQVLEILAALYGEKIEDVAEQVYQNAYEMFFRRLDELGKNKSTWLMKWRNECIYLCIYNQVYVFVYSVIYVLLYDRCITAYLNWRVEVISRITRIRNYNIYNVSNWNT